MYEKQKVQFKLALNCTFLLLGKSHYIIYNIILLLNQRQNLFLHLQQIQS